MTLQTFSEKADLCADRLFRIAYLSLRSEADCEDAVQEALLRAWRSRDSLREEAYFETWLVRILINESRRILADKTRRRQTALDETIPAAESPPGDPILRDAIRAMEPKYRLPLILHHISGYAVDEIAEILRLPKTTVKWRLTEARKRLRNEMEREEADPHDAKKKTGKEQLLL